MVALMSEGGFDLVTASGDSSNRLISAGLVQEINTDLVPSYGNIDERLQEAPHHFVDGKHYGVPYSTGSNVLMYNTESFPEPPTSWNVVFEEVPLADGSTNLGKIEAYDGPIYVADAALYLKYHQPDLGITDPYALTRDQFNAALDLLRQQRELIYRYWHDAYIQMDDFTNEGVVASASWPFQVNFLKGGGAPISSVVPVEGATGWADSTMLHIDAPHPNCAYMWMEHSLEPKVQADLAYWFSNVPTVLEACEGDIWAADPYALSTSCETNGLAAFDEIAFWKTPTATCPDGSQECVPYHEWVTNYIAVIGGR
jgi:putative spermidine/putrescine transport system substrate-binding protein